MVVAQCKIESESDETSVYTEGNAVRALAG